jgi:hypothetical protein
MGPITVKVKGTKKSTDPLTIEASVTQESLAAVSLNLTDPEPQ